MGSEIPSASTCRLVAEIRAPGKVACVQFLRDGELLHEQSPNEDVCRMELVDKRDADGPATFYHCRVRQADGHLAVCSPVWVG